MSGLTKLGFALVLIFSLSLLGLATELLYLLHRHRWRWLHLRSPADPELGYPRDWPSSRELLLHVLCFTHRSRVEPASVTPPLPAVPSVAAAAAAPPKPPLAPLEEAKEEECDLAQWRRAMSLGPSRALYTINEEEEGRDDEDDDDEEEETPFTTPCASPGFYTPSPSPSRASEEDGDDAGGGAEVKA